MLVFCTSEGETFTLFHWKWNMYEASQWLWVRSHMLNYDYIDLLIMIMIINND